jgi:uncharacterized DUF497 family protein
VRFEWDEAKSDVNFEERDRQQVSGQVTRRIISARRSNRHERKIYEKAKP